MRRELLHGCRPSAAGTVWRGLWWLLLSHRCRVRLCLNTTVAGKALRRATPYPALTQQTARLSSERQSQRNGGAVRNGSVTLLVCNMAVLAYKLE